MLFLLLLNLFLLFMLLLRLPKRRQAELEEKMQEVVAQFDRIADRNITLAEEKIEELKEWLQIADKKILQLRKLLRDEESNISRKL
jgi:preprotein translocase subunit YajC